ncbi:MAG: formylglycine-generating enzyme family protein [Pseudomonadota bacterium]
MRKTACLLSILCAFITTPALGEEDSFVKIFKDQAKKRDLLFPDDVNWKAYEFVPIVRENDPVTFKMGSDKGEVDEKPVHEVTLTEPFEMQRTEVTQLQWALIMSRNPSQFKEGKGKITIPPEIGADKNTAYANTFSVLYNRPVESIMFSMYTVNGELLSNLWDVAELFIEVLNKLDTVYTYNFPTEAQWEYAAKSGTDPEWEYFFGDNARKLKHYAWYIDNSNGETRDVARKDPNGFGLYDILGNVEEMILDCYDENYYATCENTDPKNIIRDVNSSNQCNHVIRGGNFGRDADGLRLTNRGFDANSHAYYCKVIHGKPACVIKGLRLVRTLKKAPQN